MLSDKFIARLSREFPSFYDRVNQEAMHEASRLRAEAGGDVEKALVRARFEGAAKSWWPYVKGTVPLVGDDRPAMEAFTRLVLTVDHLVGYQPPSMEAARDQVARVLGEAVDYERLQRLFDRSEKGEEVAEKAGAAAAGAGVMASMTTFLAPFTTFRRFRKYVRYVPPPVRVALGGVIVATLLSVPLVAGYTTGLKAEEAARNFGEPHAATPAPSAGSNGGAGQRASRSETKAAP